MMAGPASVKGQLPLGVWVTGLLLLCLGDSVRIMTCSNISHLCRVSPSFGCFSLLSFMGHFFSILLLSHLPFPLLLPPSGRNLTPHSTVGQVTINFHAGERKVSPRSSPLFLHGRLLWLLEPTFGFPHTAFCSSSSSLPGCFHPVFPAGSPSPALGLNVGPCQGPSLGPFFLFTYMLSLGNPIHFRGFKYHLRDNDFPIYTSSTNILRLQTHISCSLTSPLR